MMASCACSNIEIMQIFYELKQKFPFVPDHIVSECILQNAHNKTLCENELAEENSRYLTHCFPQGLVDKMAEEEEEKKGQVFFERGYPRRSLDNTQCTRRKSSSGAEEMKGKISKKLALGLPPKHAKRAYKAGVESLASLYSTQGSGSSTLDAREKKRHGLHKKDKAHGPTTIKMDHRGNLEKYRKFDEIVAKGKYKKLDDITNTQNVANTGMSESQKLHVAQQMLGLKDDEALPPNLNVSRSPNVPQINLNSPPHANDDRISANTRWNYQRSASSYLPSTSSSNEVLLASPTAPSSSSHRSSSPIRPDVLQVSTSADRGALKLDLSPQQPIQIETKLDSSNSPTNQQVPHFHLSVPSSSGPCVSVLSYSAPSTPMSATPPMFPPLAVDVHTGGHRTSLSLEPLSQYGLSEDPTRPLTKVTLSLKPPGDDETFDSLSRPNTSTSGLTYTSYSLKDGVQAQLHISIGSNLSPASSPFEDPTLSHITEAHGETQQITMVARNILSAQMERKAKLFNALLCERERLSAIKRDITTIEEKMKARTTTAVQHKPSKIMKIQMEIKALKEECAEMSKACKDASTGPAGPEPPGWICYMCTFLNHHALPKCEQCDMPRVNLAAC